MVFEFHWFSTKAWMEWLRLTTPPCKPPTTSDKISHEWVGMDHHQVQALHSPGICVGGSRGEQWGSNGPEKRRIHTELMDTHWEAQSWGRNLKRAGETGNSSAQSTNGQSRARRSVQGLKDEAVQISWIVKADQPGSLIQVHTLVRKCWVWEQNWIQWEQQNQKKKEGPCENG